MADTLVNTCNCQPSKTQEIIAHARALGMREPAPELRTPEIERERLFGADNWRKWQADPRNPKNQAVFQSPHT